MEFALRRSHSWLGMAAFLLAVGLVVLAIAPFDGRTVSASSERVGDEPDTSVLWSAGAEDGTTSEWSADGGGWLVNSGSAEAEVSSDVSRSGDYSLRASIWTPNSPTSGVRAFRWLEARSHQELYYSAWIYLPTAYTLTDSPRDGGYWNAFQFKSRSADGGRNDPVWAFYAAPDEAGGLYLRAGWGWGGTTLAGPYPTDRTGGKFYEPSTRIPLPVGRWVHLQAFLRQSNGFDGRLTFWQDGEKLFDFEEVRTSYENCTYNSWCTDNEWSVNLYSDGLSPNPATLYIDDASISKEYVS